MDFNEIGVLISTVGFPIVCTGAMWLSYTKTLAEMDKTIERNTIALQRLLDKLGGGDIDE